MAKTLEEKLEKFGMPPEYKPACIECKRKTLEVLETLKHYLNYKTVDVKEWRYTGGRTKQVERVGELAQLGDTAITVIRKLAKTGYQIDTYWESEGSIGEGDMTVIKKLSNEEVMNKYLGIVSKAQKLFKNRAFCYYAENALAIISLFNFEEKDAEKAIRFLGQSNCLGFFNQKNHVSQFLLESITRSDEKITVPLLEKLRQNFSYKTVDVKEYDYTGGHTGQIIRILKISELGEKALTVLDILAKTGYKLDDYWESEGSIGEDDMTVIKKLSNEEVMNKYLGIVSKAQKLFKNRAFCYYAENALSMINLSKFDQEESSKIISFLNDCGYFDFFNQKSNPLLNITLEMILKHDYKKVKEVLEKLRQHFNYKTVKVQDYCTTGGAPGQITRILEISEIENATNILEKLASTGYKLDDYWDSKGAIEREDIEVFDTLSKYNILTKQENLERYIKIVDEIKKTFKQPKMKYEAANAKSMINLLRFPKEEASKIIRFLKYCNCHDFFKGCSSLQKDLLTQIAFSDMDTVKKVFKTLSKKFNYQTVSVEKYDYTGGPTGQIRRILEISELGEKAVNALEALATTGHKLNSYWDFEGSIGEDDVRAVKRLVKADIIEKYKQVIKGLRKLGYNVKPDLERTIEITKIPEAVDAITMLASQGYKIDEEKISQADIKNIRRLAEELFDKKLENIKVKIEHKCLYKEDAKEFIKTFSNLKNVNDKKKIIKALLNCEYNNQEAIKWLDENEPKLVREVGMLL